jgi:uncharacterized membrane-anchored protein YhcB (DUF1043 family)
VKNTEVVVSRGRINTHGVIHIIVGRIVQMTFQRFQSNSVDHQLQLQYPVC